MNDAITVLLWALGIIVVIETGVIVGLFFMYNSHVQDCKEHRQVQAVKELDNALTQGRMMEKMEQVQKNIGDHDSGMIAQLHRYSKDLRDLTHAVTELNKQQGSNSYEMR